MIKKGFLILFALAFVTLQAQDLDTLYSKQVDLKEVVITATLTERKLEDIPAQVTLIKSREIQDFPTNTIDDLLKTAANVYVNRSWGIFSKNASVTMRGLESSARTLVLLDGVPKNKIAGGSVNWHSINIDNIERIEIIKGPASSLYGNNAMGGVINLITKKPSETIEGTAKVFYGTYNSWGGSMNILGSTIKKNKGFYWGINDFYRQGDGYVFEAPAYIDETDVKTALKEYGGGVKTGYQFNKFNSIEVIYDYYNEHRGAGRQVFLEEGSFESYITNQVKTIYNGKLGTANIRAIAYYTMENYYGQKESMNDYGEYKLLDSYADRSDKGLWATYSDTFLRKNYITFGAELKMGEMDGSEIYRTSPDQIIFRSKMDIAGFFIQDEINFFNDKLKLVAGLRYDIVSFHDGFQNVINPSKATGFPESFSEEFKTNTWKALSPKVSLQYSLTEDAKIYASISEGYMPPTLKDLSQSGKITKGFRLANPNINPESLTNYEIGFSQVLNDKVIINSAVYYTQGRDFNYMIGTGDSIDTGGSSLKPVIYADNVAKIGIYGAELSARYQVNKQLFISANYSYNDSRITEFEVSEINPTKDLTNKKMVETSPHLFFAGLTYHHKYFTTHLNCNYVDEQWYDDENTVVIEDYFVANVKFSKVIHKHYKVYLDIQNLFDNAFVDRKGQLSPGRFIMAGFQYKI